MAAAGRHIVFVNRFFYPDESATSQMLTDLAVYLSKQGEAVTVLTGRQAGGRSGRLPSRDTYEGIAIRRVWSMPQKGGSLLSKVLSFATFYPSALIALLSLLRRGDILVLKTDPPLISVAGMLAAKARGAAQVNWLQDVYPEVAMRLQVPMVSGGLGRLLRWLRDAALRSADMNVVIGDLMRGMIASRGVQTAKIAVIPNWADEAAIVPREAASSLSRQDWGIPPEQFVLGYSGNLGKAHECDTLLAAAKLLSHRRDISFLFVGGGHEMERLRPLIADHGLTNVLFRPHQPRDRLTDSLAAADAHWISLRPELEGLIVPSKLYGILAAGRPVVAVTDPKGEVAEVVRGHDCGLVVRPGNAAGLAKAVEFLADDPPYRRMLGRNARAASEGEFAKNSTLNAWSALLAGLSHGSDRKQQKQASRRI